MKREILAGEWVEKDGLSGQLGTFSTEGSMCPGMAVWKSIVCVGTFKFQRIDEPLN